MTPRSDKEFRELWRKVTFQGRDMVTRIRINFAHDVVNTHDLDIHEKDFIMFEG